MARLEKVLLGKFIQRPEWNGLTNLQKVFFRSFFDGRNIFLTGPAGTGKSYAVSLLFKFLDEMQVFYGKTATTGVAALNIGGTTLHSWSGMGLADDNGMELLDKVSSNSKASNRIKHSRVLVIDEISMAKSDLVEKLDIVCQFIRNNDKPFGGIQLVFVGDFMQLPPVFKHFEEERFAFESQAWRDAKVKTIQLVEIVRQHDEPHFAKFLNSVRLGTAENYNLLEDCVGRSFPDDGIQPVRLFCKNINVDAYNRAELAKIHAPSQHYYAVDEGSESWRAFFDKNSQSPTELELKVGAQVILLKNLDVLKGLVNGSVGIVEKLYDNLVDVKFINGVFPVEFHKWEIKQHELDPVTNTMRKVIVATRKQLPLRLAWALTVHKGQGSTLDRAEIDVSEAFACGQVYVALSRVRNLSSLRINRFHPGKIMVNRKCLNFYTQKDEQDEEEKKFFEEPTEQ
jgi:ATP-dependent DNA helicase PIF1